jgi:hypothetical protein
MAGIFEFESDHSSHAVRSLWARQRTQADELDCKKQVPPAPFAPKRQKIEVKQTQCERSCERLT